MGVVDQDGAQMDRRGVTKPLTPLPADEKVEEREVGMRGPRIEGDKIGRGGKTFWKTLRCW